MSCACFAQVGGNPPGSAAAPTAEAEVWTERYLGDFAAAPVTDLPVAAPPNPTVVVPNGTTTTGQVADATWTSNAGDATGTVVQTTNLVSFGTDGATGLVYDGNALGSALMTEVSANAAHVWTQWSQLLNEDPRSGVDYCVLVMFDSQDVNTNGQACGLADYVPNDGVVVPDTQGNPAIDDEKRLSGWIERTNNVTGVLSREESVPFQQISGARLPGGFDVVGLLFRAGSYVECVVGTSVAGVFPGIDTLTSVPGPFLGGSTTYPGHPYTDPLERIAIAFQQVLGSEYDATVSRVQVSSRLGRPAP
jgi:hypothetical protein